MAFDGKKSLGSLQGSANRAQQKLNAHLPAEFRDGPMYDTRAVYGNGPRLSIRHVDVSTLPPPPKHFSQLNPSSSRSSSPTKTASSLPKQTIATQSPSLTSPSPPMSALSNSSRRAPPPPPPVRSPLASSSTREESASLPPPPYTSSTSIPSPSMLSSSMKNNFPAPPLRRSAQTSDMNTAPQPGLSKPVKKAPPPAPPKPRRLASRDSTPSAGTVPAPPPIQRNTRPSF
ncbi:hypothetical protein SOMG_00630 [Schizosaccharomyces osmophilus]|uniref:Uncharacterized protein n=1 Tax=Schizosaccharomyces osmophilus TaxID=2545709 RepID=A0AAE9WDI2_9SCHI|nr:uncharacterized protein SOMG_00630 [Schizosaccharomyces osmophilus]WBW72713.1 hypothetical protein SOMG_00630 [Schizosaccharomyces osmophilus]